MTGLIIGIAGRAGSGKTTTAKYLEEKYGAVRASFAAPLKEIAAKVWGFSNEQLFGSQVSKETVDPRVNMSPREALIRLGNSAREVLGESVWLDACLHKLSNPKTTYVIEDVRYNNEAKAIYDLGGFVIKLQCVDASSAVDKNAPSERSVDEIERKYLFDEISINRSDNAYLLLDEVERTLGPILKQRFKLAIPL